MAIATITHSIRSTQYHVDVSKMYVRIYPNTMSCTNVLVMHAPTDRPIPSRSTRPTTRSTPTRESETTTSAHDTSKHPVTDLPPRSPLAQPREARRVPGPRAPASWEGQCSRHINPSTYITDRCRFVGPGQDYSFDQENRSRSSRGGGHVGSRGCVHWAPPQPPTSSGIGSPRSPVGRVDERLNRARPLPRVPTGRRTGRALSTSFPGASTGHPIDGVGNGGGWGQARPPRHRAAPLKDGAGADGRGERAGGDQVARSARLRFSTSRWIWPPCSTSSAIFLWAWRTVV